MIGISTGGPQALKLLIPRLPAELPVPVAIVLHMPVGYTELYARKLDEQSALDVVEARDGEQVTAGTGVSCAGRTPPELPARRRRVSRSTHLDVRPLDTPHRPSVDVLFQSAAEALRRARAGRRDDRYGLRRPRRRGVDQGQGGTILTEAGGELRRVRHAALGRRGRAERRERRLEDMADAIVELRL